MSNPPNPYNRSYNFEDFQTLNPNSPLPAQHVENELNNIEETLDATVSRLSEIQNVDGSIKLTANVQQMLLNAASVEATSVANQVSADYLAANFDSNAAASASSFANSAAQSALQSEASKVQAGVYSTAAQQYAASSYAHSVNAANSKNSAEDYADSANASKIAAHGYKLSAQNAQNGANSVYQSALQLKEGLDSDYGQLLYKREDVNHVGANMLFNGGDINNTLIGKIFPGTSFDLNSKLVNNGPINITGLNYINGPWWVEGNAQAENPSDIVTRDMMNCLAQTWKTFGPNVARGELKALQTGINGTPNPAWSQTDFPDTTFIKPIVYDETDFNANQSDPVDIHSAALTPKGYVDRKLQNKLTYENDLIQLNLNTEISFNQGPFDNLSLSFYKGLVFGTYDIYGTHTEIAKVKAGTISLENPDLNRKIEITSAGIKFADGSIQTTASNNSNYLPLSGGTMTGKLKTNANTSSVGLNLSPSNPTSAVTGDIWFPTAGGNLKYVDANSLTRNIASLDLNQNWSNRQTFSSQQNQGNSVISVSNTYAQTNGGNAISAVTSAIQKQFAAGYFETFTLATGIIIKSTRAGTGLLIDTSTECTGTCLDIQNYGNGTCLNIMNYGTGNCVKIEDQLSPDPTPFTISNSGRVGIGISPDSAVALTVDSTGIKFSDGSVQTVAATIPNLSGYATQSWVTSQGYITSSALTGYATLASPTFTGDVNISRIKNPLNSNFVIDAYNDTGAGTHNYFNFNPYGGGLELPINSSGIKFGDGTIQNTASISPNLSGYAQLSGATFTGQVIGNRSTTAAGFNIKTGVIPDSTVAGDLWIGSTGIRYADSNNINRLVADTNRSNTFTTNQYFQATDTNNSVVNVTANGNGGGLKITNLGTGESLRVEDETSPDATPFVISNSGRVGIGVAPDATVALTVDSTGIKVNGAKLIPAATVTNSPFTSGNMSHSEYTKELLININGVNYAIVLRVV